MLSIKQIQNTYFGFTNSKTALSQTRIEDTLNKLIMYNGEVMTRKQFVYIKLHEGCKPEVAYDVVYYSRKLQDYTKPKTEYRLSKDNLYNEVSKTEYDYAVYLLSNNILDDEAALRLIENEINANRIAEEKRIEAERLAKEAEERAVKEKEEFEAWLKSEAENYKDTEKIELQKQIFMHEVGSYHPRSIQLLVMIDNIDNPKCKEKLKDWLHNSNTASKKTFTHITGISLHPTDKRTREILDNISKADFQGMIPFKPRQKHEVQLETFYIFEFNSDLNKYVYSEVTAEPLEKYGLKLFIRNFSGKYSISEAKTGLGMGSGKTKQAALDELKNAVERYGIEKINSLIDQHIEKHGISPKFLNEQNIKSA